MKKIIKEILGYTLVKWFFLTGKKPDQVLSITFHQPSVELFRDVLYWLRQLNYRIIALPELESVLDKATINEKVAFITIDDGWRSNLKLLPILDTERVPIAIFIPSEPVLSGNYWWEYAKADGQSAISGIHKVADFKSLPDEERNQKVTAIKASIILQRSCVTKDELTLLANNKWVTIGSHTITHPILKHCSSLRQEEELAGSKQVLGEWLAKPIEYFAYPNGDYNADTLRLVKASGYRMSFTDRHGKIELPWTNKMEIPRNSLNDEGGYYENYSKLLGIWQKVFGEN